MKLYIGVDGGGTKTEVFAFDLEHRRGNVSAGAASNPSTVGWEQAMETVETLIRTVTREAGGSVDDVKGLSLCMSGVDRPEQGERVRSHFAPLFPNAKVEVANDALAALAAGTRGSSGVVLIAGTGSIAVGESDRGKVVRAGGYGNLIGDEGSGFVIGRAGLMAAVQSREGRGPETTLWERTKEQFGIAQPGEIIPKIYGSHHPVGTIASFAPHVLAEATHDEVAARIVAEAVDNHVALIRSVRTQLSDDISDKVILAGGLFTNTPVLADKVRLALPELTFTVLKERASAGAALRALAFSQSGSWSGEPATSGLIDAWEEAVRATS
ncbi:N-acetylglucosamine kinase [Alicyclobacillus dauci]|uniref:ATPase BadF/BadG/BcrA/BcrD type domain-containing protein n=1 Tax=Alicyclobacillus dauci TaxID=1475485 RepID=A0ABY6Z3U1_9BACL|nr:BadF/BadG/BcrA/BcrD ATPase family protein [Alicyclobacillus dauci]WAH37188.1 hypothetical protein NZD86_01155 [Alicyclobacillus dauci]